MNLRKVLPDLYLCVTAGPNCVNGVRGLNGLCMCAAGFKGADCNVPIADISLNQGMDPQIKCAIPFPPSFFKMLFLQFLFSTCTLKP